MKKSYLFLLISFLIPLSVYAAESTYDQKIESQREEQSPRAPGVSASAQKGRQAAQLESHSADASQAGEIKKELSDHPTVLVGEETTPQHTADLLSTATLEDPYSDTLLQALILAQLSNHTDVPETSKADTGDSDDQQLALAIAESMLLQNKATQD